MSIEFDYISDIHLEERIKSGVNFFRKPENTRNSFYTDMLGRPEGRNHVVLILAGDICCLTHPLWIRIFAEFINVALENYQTVIFVPGNHEYYNNVATGCKSICKLEGSYPVATVADVQSVLREEERRCGFRFRVLRGGIWLDEKDKQVYVCGSTLWTNVSSEHQEIIQEALGDYRHIYLDQSATLIRPNDVRRLHNCEFKTLNECILYAQEQGAKSVVIVTHHPPLMSGTTDTVRFGSVEQNPLISAYCSDMCEWIKERIESDPSESRKYVWVFGHTHVTTRLCRTSNFTLLSNAIGYKDETKLPNMKTFTL
jgi:predicted phosphohydrolase